MLRLKRSDKNLHQTEIHLSDKNLFFTKEILLCFFAATLFHFMLFILFPIHTYLYDQQDIIFPPALVLASPANRVELFVSEEPGSFPKLLAPKFTHPTVPDNSIDIQTTLSKFIKKNSATTPLNP